MVAVMTQLFKQMADIAMQTQQGTVITMNVTMTNNLPSGESEARGSCLELATGPR